MLWLDVRKNQPLHEHSLRKLQDVQAPYMAPLGINEFLLVKGKLVIPADQIWIPALP